MRSKPTFIGLRSSAPKLHEPVTSFASYRLKSLTAPETPIERQSTQMITFETIETGGTFIGRFVFAAGAIYGVFAFANFLGALASL